MDSRLRNKTTPLNGHDLEARRSYSFEVGPETTNLGVDMVTQYHSTSDLPKMNGGVTGGVAAKTGKQLARSVLSQHIKRAEENEKKQVKSPPPVSTKGEATPTTESTKTSPDSTQKRWSSNPPKQQRRGLPNHHVTEFSKAGSAPPCLPPKGGATVAMATTTAMSKAHGMKQLNTVGKGKSSTTLVGVAGKTERPPAPDPISPSSDENAPLIRKCDSTSSSGDLYSPTDDFTFLPVTSHGGLPKSPISGSSSLNRSSSGSNQNYDRLDDFLVRKHDSWESFGTSGSNSPAPPPSSAPPPSFLLLPPTDSLGRDSQSYSRLSGSSSNESGIYDHLPPGPEDHLHEDHLHGDHLHGDYPASDSEAVLLDTATVRRNISQPALSTPQSARESQCDQFGRFGSINEESSDEELGATPTNSDQEGKEGEGEGEEGNKVTFEGVTLRQKKRQQHLEDPFAELLTSPKAASRLRWSQELNPLYDYIKGFKAEGVKLYDSSPVSKLLLSSTAAGKEGGGKPPLVKPPSIILEDEGEEGAYSVSDDVLSMGSLDTPTSPCSSFGEDGTGSEEGITKVTLSLLLLLFVFSK